jgi:hypothetical protein
MSYFVFTRLRAIRLPDAVGREITSSPADKLACNANLTLGGAHLSVCPCPVRDIALGMKSAPDDPTAHTLWRCPYGTEICGLRFFGRVDVVELVSASLFRFPAIAKQSAVSGREDRVRKSRFVGSWTWPTHAPSIIVVIPKSAANLDKTTNRKLVVGAVYPAIALGGCAARRITCAGPSGTAGCPCVGPNGVPCSASSTRPAHTPINLPHGQQ